ncbi:MAG: carbamoyltransferase HypF [Thermoplasmatota archaeon]
MRIVIKGTVQGVGFRPTVYRVAKSLGLKGHVKNMGSEVEVVIDGDVDEFITELEENLPPLAEITEIDIYEERVDREDFEIVPSSKGEKKSSTIPVDTALCEDCSEEMRTKGDRREGYAFTNCTNCGARYSAIYSLPYDREKTTMKEFPMCEDCREEYEDPMNRRFHAQTTSCPDCGPHYTLYNAEKEELGGIDEFCELIEDGEIAVAKSWGGMHIVCKLESIPELREKYHRPEKPFAVMMPDVETVSEYAFVEREDVLAGPRRPIMIYEKKGKHKDLLDLAAPGLPTIGVMLPYTGLHHLIFDKIDENALVMTSANIPKEPMIIRNKDAFSLDLDYFLLHNRKIANRIDDSLIRVHGDDLAMIRRSRGYVPDYLDFFDDNVMGAGADQSGCIAFSKDGRLYPSQYLGDLGSYGTKVFYEDTVDYLTDILGIDDVSAVGVDLHPKYQSRKLGTKYADKFDADLVEVQHHWAHGASLLLEHDLEEIICIAVDGTGYGEDGNSWGGEVLYCTGEDYERMYHLENFPLIGGDQAVKDPRRLVYAIQRKMGLEGDYFDERDSDIFDKMMSDAADTRSFGRLLDAVSCTLDVCCERKYEGEPAMKLESLLFEGQRRKDYVIPLEGDVIKTLNAFIEMQEDDMKNKDRAVSYVSSISRSIAQAAIEAAEEKGIESIGLSGGVSYNRPIVETIRNYLKEYGYDLFVHQRVPNGDMGVPIGQAFIASYRF